MHILQLLPELNQGGVERGTIDVNRELILLGYKSTVISAGGIGVNQIIQDNGSHIKLDICSKNLITFFKRSSYLTDIINNLKPCIIHARSRVPAWIAWHANKNHSIPFITTVHGFNSINKYSSIMTKGDRIIYGSSSIRDHITSNYKVNENKLRYVPRGIDIKYFNEKCADTLFINEFKKRYKLEDKIIISSVGRITEWKGHDDFIKAISINQKSNNNIVGLIIGNTSDNKKPYLEYLKSIVRKYDANIIFINSANNIRELYALSDVCVSAASSKPETFGRSIAEALSMNTPVIASEHGGSLDIIKNEENGFFFKPGDVYDLSSKIKGSIDYKFNNMSSHIKKYFSLDIMINKLTDVYKELV